MPSRWDSCDCCGVSRIWQGVPVTSPAILSGASAWPRLTERIEGQLMVVERLTWGASGWAVRRGRDPDVWRCLTAFSNVCENAERLHQWLQETLAAAEMGTEGVWAIVERKAVCRSVALDTWRFARRIADWRSAGPGSVRLGGAPERTSRRSCCCSSTPSTPSTATRATYVRTPLWKRSRAVRGDPALPHEGSRRLA